MNKAREFVFASLEFNRRIGDKSGIAGSLIIPGGRLHKCRAIFIMHLDTKEVLACGRESGKRKVLQVHFSTSE
ncbi:MAG: hypothetical protein IPL67_17930 [Ignavibacteria bacterium]|nr:hypothetical protein [Ignavibacteria bacterium]